MKKALIAGASGLVGRELLQLLLDREGYDEVTAIVRKPLQIKHPKLIQITADFDRLQDVQESLRADDVFCCLGTTIKKAKTKEAMYKVDVEYPITLAKLAKEQGAAHFLVISSMNANAKSLFFYPRMKGQMEKQLKKISYASISIIQPSLLLGEREEFRLGENLAIRLVRGLSWITGGRISSKIAIEANDVAAAMYNIAVDPKRGINVYDSAQLGDLAVLN